MTEDKRPKKRGRPPLPDSERKGGSNITFRARGGLRERLAQAAAKAERSISEEIEHRLERYEDMGEGPVRDLLIDLAGLVRFVEARSGWKFTNTPEDYEKIATVITNILDSFRSGHTATPGLAKSQDNQDEPSEEVKPSAKRAS
jgi:hypothetical protein